MQDEILFRVDGASATQVSRRELDELELEERKHLQEWVLANPSIVGQDSIVVTSEFDRWESADGSPVADRLDILALDAEGRLVVVELKRGRAPHTVHMQAINYAAMVSRLTLDDVAEMYASRQSTSDRPITKESALEHLTTQQLLTVEGIRRPRIILIASDFPPAVTSSVVWLNEQNVDIDLIRYRAYEVNGEVVVSFSRLYPVPNVEEFTIGRRAEPVKVVDEGAPWDYDSLRRLAEVGNPATLAMLDLCATSCTRPGRW